MKYWKLFSIDALSGVVLARFLRKRESMSARNFIQSSSRLALLTCGMWALLAASVMGQRDSLDKPLERAPQIRLLERPQASPSVVFDGNAGEVIPFATVENRNSGVFVAADVLGEVVVPIRGVEDTLVVRSLGYMDLVILPLEEVPTVIRMVQDVVSLASVEVVTHAGLTSGDYLRTANAVNASAAQRLQVARVEVPQTAAELLWSTGSVLVQQSQQGGGSPVIRGFEANRVLLVVDGVRMNNAIYRSGHLHNAITVDAQILQSTDVVLGPNGVMYGSDALGGVIHFQTRNPRLGKPGVITRYGASFRSPNQSTGMHVDVEAANERFASLTSISHARYGDLRMGGWRPHGDATWGLDTTYVAQIHGRDTVLRNADPRLQVGSGYHQTDLLQKFKFPVGAGMVLLNFQYSTSSNVPRYDVTNDFSGGTHKWAQWDYGPQERLLAAANFRHRLDWHDVQLAVQLDYQNIRETRIKRQFQSATQFTQDEVVDVWGGSIGFSKRWYQGIEMNAGLTGTYNHVTSTAWANDLPTTTRYPNGGSEMITGGLFVAGKYPWRQHHFSAGFRYSLSDLDARYLPDPAFTLPFDRIQSRKGATTGALAANLAWSDAWETVSSVSSGFRHPNVDDIAKIREKGGYLVVPNDSLRPEYLYSLEQAVVWIPGGSDVVRVAGSGFVSWWKDAIVPVDAQLSGQSMWWYEGDSVAVQTNANAENALIHGARVELSAQLFPKVGLQAAINWTRGMNKSTNERLSHIAPTFGRLAADYEHRWLTAELYTMFSGAKAIEDYGPGGTDNPEEALEEGTPAWWTLNFECSAQLHDKFQLRLGVRNVLDMHYRVFSSGISAAGRGVYVSLHGRF
jgi:hemoglobin/transferrin/lactoferrin receptor protein